MRGYKTVVFVSFLSSILLGSFGLTVATLSVFTRETYADAGPSSDEPATPLQQALHEMILSAQNEGRPTPEVSFESSVLSASSGETIAGADAGSSNVTLVGKTIVQFDGPNEAGKEEWDDFIVEEHDDLEIADGLIIPGNYTQRIIDSLPEIYGSGGYQYGTEPRTLIIEERLTVVALVETDLSTVSAASFPMSPQASSSPSSEIVMDFSLAPKKIDYLIQFKLVVLGITIAEGKAGFLLDVGIGLRLPASVDIISPEALDDGQAYFLETSLTPLDFEAADYDRLGLPEVEGKEFFAKIEFFLGAKLTVVGVPVIDFVIADIDLDLAEECTNQNNGIDCSNFVTPFGTDENGFQREFPLPDLLTLSPNDTGLKLNISVISVGVGIRLDPEIGSGKISANWSASGDSSGYGELKYSNSYPASVAFGPILADDSINNGDTATITLDNYKFHITEQKINLKANLQFKFFGFIPLNTPYVNLLNFDLSSIFGEPALGQHKGTGGITTVIPVVSDGSTNDELFCGRTLRDFTIVGTSGNDNLSGTQGIDLIFGGNGDDIIRGFDGNDIICGGGGDDTLLGGLGDDQVMGGRGNDLLSGGLGNDKLLGGTGWDTLNGGAGEDFILGEVGNDSLKGGSGNDTMDGSDGRDILDGGKETDSCKNAENTKDCESS